MNKLILLLALTAACGDSGSNPTPDAPVTPPPDAATAAPCFSGTPTQHDQLINACVDQSVTVIVKYPTLQSELTALPKLNADGTLPTLP